MAESALQRIESHRADLLIFEICGKIEGSDMSHMADHVGAAFDHQGKVDILVIMRDFEGATLGAVTNPAALTEELRSIKDVRRYGVVGAPLWARAMIEAADLISPVHAKTFEIEELPDATAWIDSL